MSKSARNHNSHTAPLRESSHLHFMQTESRYFHWLVTTCAYWSNPATVVYDSFFAWENKKRRSIFFLMHLRNPKIKTPLAESVSHKKSKCALAHIHVRRRHRTLCVCHCFPPLRMKEVDGAIWLWQWKLCSVPHWPKRAAVNMNIRLGVMLYIILDDPGHPIVKVLRFASKLM